MHLSLTRCLTRFSERFEYSRRPVSRAPGETTLWTWEVVHDEALYGYATARSQIDRAEEVPPPVMVVVMGPKGSGKTTLIRSLIKLYTGA